MNNVTDRPFDVGTSLNNAGFYDDAEQLCNFIPVQEQQTDARTADAQQVDAADSKNTTASLEGSAPFFPQIENRNLLNQLVEFVTDEASAAASMMGASPGSSQGSREEGWSRDRDEQDNIDRDRGRADEGW